MRFKRSKEDDNRTGYILEKVYQALEEKGYNPVNQIVGYLLSGDPAYITSYKDARTMIRTVDRDEIIEELLRNYLNK
nr:IreB family regulatory phosphoprotein [Halothermothrix orenii]